MSQPALAQDITFPRFSLPTVTSAHYRFERVHKVSEGEFQSIPPVDATISYTATGKNWERQVIMGWNPFTSGEIILPMDTRLRDEIKARFDPIPDIASIYENEPGKDYVIFLNHTQYDRELMYRLLDIEIEIRDKFEYMPFSMFYLPLFDKDKGGVIYPDAKPILSH